MSRHSAGIERDRPLELGNGFPAPRLRTQHLTLCVMRERAVRRCCQSLLGQPLRPLQVGIRVGAELIGHPDRQRHRQPGSRIDRFRVERQGSLEKLYRLVVVFPRDRSRQHGAAAQQIIERVGIVGRVAGFCDRELRLQRSRDARGNLVLHGEQVADVRARGRWRKSGTTRLSRRSSA